MLAVGRSVSVIPRRPRCPRHDARRAHKYAHTFSASRISVPASSIRAHLGWLASTKVTLQTTTHRPGDVAPVTPALLPGSGEQPGGRVPHRGGGLLTDGENLNHQHQRHRGQRRQ